jgi:hypothetical protein
MAHFFVMGVHDDPPGVVQTMAFEPGLSQLAHVLAATPSVVVVVDSVLAAAIIAFALVLLGFLPATVMVVAVLTFVVSFAIHVRYARGRIRHLQGAVRPVFPSSPSD